MTSQIDHQSLAVSRLATQFREATNLINYVRSQLKEANDLEQVFQDLLNKRWLDTAEGVQLDILGELVGLKRNTVADSAFPFFGFKGVIRAGTFDSTSGEVTAENFRSRSDVQYTFALINDATYVKLLKATIIKNHTDSTIEDVINAVQTGFDNTSLTITESDAEFTITWDRVLTDSEKLFIATSRLVPKPAGVRVKHADDNGVFII